MEWFLLGLILWPLFILLLWIWIRNRRKLFSIFKDYGIPGPTPNFWVGNLNDYLQKREGCLLEYSEKYGHIFGCFFGAKPLLVVSDPDLVKTIQVTEFKSFSNRCILLPDAGVPHPDALHSLAIKKDKEWRLLRSIVSPVFSTGKLKKIVPIINESVESFLGNILGKSRNNEVFDINVMLRNLTMDIFSKTQLGIKTSIQHGEKNLFLDSVSLALDTDSTDILAAISLCFPELEPIPTVLRRFRDVINYHLGQKSINTLFSLAQEIIHLRRVSNKNEVIIQSDSKIADSQDL